jgi:cob(I)alamin adenosyltransferase
MGIVTKRGDDGHTDLLFGKRAAKVDPRLEAIGAIDELNAALGLVRAVADEFINGLVDEVQDRLVGVMGELAVQPEDAGRYAESDYPSVSDADIAFLEREAEAIEAAGISFDGWARPGANGNRVGAQLDFARTICRRAERRVLALEDAVSNPRITIFLNRSSDLLWLLARKTESN